MEAVKTVSDNSKQISKLSFDYVKKMENFKSQVQKRAKESLHQQCLLGGIL